MRNLGTTQQFISFDGSSILAGTRRTGYTFSVTFVVSHNIATFDCGQDYTIVDTDPTKTFRFTNPKEHVCPPLPPRLRIIKRQRGQLPPLPAPLEEVMVTFG